MPNTNIEKYRFYEILSEKGLITVEQR
jgi:hypothetical protein